MKKTAHAPVLLSAQNSKLTVKRTVDASVNLVATKIRPKILWTVNAHALRSAKILSFKMLTPAHAPVLMSAQKAKLTVMVTVNATVLRKPQETLSKMLKTAHSHAMSANLAMSKTKNAIATALNAQSVRL